MTGLLNDDAVLVIGRGGGLARAICLTARDAGAQVTAADLTYPRPAITGPGTSQKKHSNGLSWQQGPVAGCAVPHQRRSCCLLTRSAMPTSCVLPCPELRRPGTR
jgi:hypothetical protein